MISNPAMRSAKQIAKQMVMSDWATGRRVPPKPNNKRRQCEVCGRFVNARGKCSRVFTVESGAYEHA